MVYGNKELPVTLPIIITIAGRKIKNNLSYGGKKGPDFPIHKVILRHRGSGNKLWGGLVNSTKTTKAAMVCLVAALLGVAPWGCTRTTPVHEAERQRPVSDEQYRKEMEEIKKSLRSEVRIKLKRDGKGAYSWEVSGKDPYEIIKTNGILSKKVSSD